MISYKMDPVRINVRLRDGHEVEKNSYWKNIPSKDSREGIAPKQKTYSSTKHTVAPAYNKGAYQVILKSEIKDIGK